MRILYIINAFSWGGAEKLVYDLALHIRPQVDGVAVVALYRTGDDTEKEMVRTFHRNGIATRILGKEAGSGRIRGIVDIYRFARQENSTIIHGHCSVPMLFGKIVGRMLGLPVICTIHSTRGYSARRERLTSWMADRYVSIGASAQQYMTEKLHISPAKITRIYNAIDTEHFLGVSGQEHFWEQYGGREGEKVILNVARVHDAKNQLCLARAMKRCMEAGADVRAYILGSYHESDAVYQRLKEYIDEHHLGERICFLGMHKNVAQFLANADCFLMTSCYEGLSVAFLEAVVAGLPIVTTRLGFVEELSQIAPCATVVEQDDSDAIADVILKERYVRQSQETRETFARIFSLDHFVGLHHDLYENVMRERRPCKKKCDVRK